MEFLKILWDNLKKGPVTDAFPFGETYTPDRLRGRVEIDPALCVGCGTCVHVCAAGAINISKFEDGSGFEITVWRNSCCLCAQCRHYCPTKAVTLTNDWHSAHRATIRMAMPLTRPSRPPKILLSRCSPGSLATRFSAWQRVTQTIWTTRNPAKNSRELTTKPGTSGPSRA